MMLPLLINITVLSTWICIISPVSYSRAGYFSHKKFTLIAQENSWEIFHIPEIQYNTQERKKENVRNTKNSNKTIYHFALPKWFFLLVETRKKSEAPTHFFTNCACMYYSSLKHTHSIILWSKHALSKKQTICSIRKYIFIPEKLLWCLFNLYFTCISLVFLTFLFIQEYI